MNEIEKLYENVGIKIKKYRILDRDNKPKWVYPKFTAEKQLKLIEFFISSIWWENLKILYKTLDCSMNFEDKLARIVNYLWLSLTEEEKEQIRNILEGQ